MIPYLPDIMQGIVSRVSAAFQARSDDPFTVFFDKGNLTQVGKSVAATKNHFPLVWFMMPYEVRHQANDLYGTCRCDLFLIMPTDNKYTQQQRDDIIYKPRLLPVLEVLILEIARERWFSFPSQSRLVYNSKILPYWGGGANNTTDAVNLFGQNVDAISITGLELPIRKTMCQPGQYTPIVLAPYPRLQFLQLEN